MKKRKYDDVVSVCWRDVLHCLEWALLVRRHESERWLDSIDDDIEHFFPERLRYHTLNALECCDRVLHHYELLNSVRRFLKYEPKTVEQLHIERCVNFYIQNKSVSPSSACLAANTEGGQLNSK